MTVAPTCSTATAQDALIISHTDSTGKVVLVVVVVGRRTVLSVCV